MLDPRLFNWQVHGWHLTELVPPTGKKIGVEFPFAISLKKQTHRQHLQVTLMILTSVLVKISRMSRKYQRTKQISTSFQQHIVQYLILTDVSCWVETKKVVLMNGSPFQALFGPMKKVATEEKILSFDNIFSEKTHLCTKLQFHEQCVTLGTYTHASKNGKALKWPLHLNW